MSLLLNMSEQNNRSLRRAGRKRPVCSLCGRLRSFSDTSCVRIIKNAAPLLAFFMNTHFVSNPLRHKISISHKKNSWTYYSTSSFQDFSFVASERIRTSYHRIRSLEKFHVNTFQSYSKQKAYTSILLYYKDLCN